MQHVIRIDAIIRRAEAVNLSLSELNAKAGKPAPVSTIYRWLNGETKPLLETYNKVISSLEKALQDEEARLREHLAHLEDQEVAA